jgi:hypothetical protein
MSDNGYRCGHDMCECTVIDSGMYCSQHCEQAANGKSGDHCQCGHEACEHRQLREAQASQPGYAGPT